MCGLGDLADTEAKNNRHMRTNYNSPTDRFHTKCTVVKYIKPDTKKVYIYYGAALCPDHQARPNTSRKLLDWLKEKNIRHEMFTIRNPLLQASKSARKAPKDKNCHENISDKEVMRLLKEEMTGSDLETE